MALSLIAIKLKRTALQLNSRSLPSKSSWKIACRPSPLPSQPATMAFCTKDFALPSSFLAVPAAETVSMSEVTAIVPVHGRWELTAQLMEDLRSH